MSNPIFEPPPTYADPFIKEAGKEKFNPIWLRWFLKLVAFLTASGAGGGGAANHNSLAGLQGGTTAEYYHLTAARYSTLTGVQGVNTVFAGPSSGGSAIATFRALAAADLPAGTGTVTSITAGTGLSGGTITTTGTIAIASTIVAGGPTGGAATVPVITYNAQGQLTAVTTASITPAAIGAPSGSGTSTGSNTGDQTITLTGDATGSGTGTFATSVVKINGTLMSGLATGILKNTTATGVPSIATAGTDYSAGTSGLATGILKSTTATGVLTIAVAGDFPTLNQDTTGKSAKTDALNSATTVVDVSAATAPSNGQVLTATDSTHATWQNPSAAAPGLLAFLAAHG